MRGLLRRIAAPFVFGRQARIETFRLAADLIEAEFALERVLNVAASVAGEQGKRGRRRMLLGWRRALPERRFAEEVRRWVPASEAMIFSGYGRVDPVTVFSGAARVALMRHRQMSAVVKATAAPGLVLVTMLVMLWGAGGWLIPVLESVVPAERWGLLSGVFRGVSLWLYEDVLVVGVGLAGAISGLIALTLNYTGPGRKYLDRVAPFSLYRLIVGSAFLFVALEYHRPQSHRRCWEQEMISSAHVIRTLPGQVLPYLLVCVSVCV